MKDRLLDALGFDRGACYAFDARHEAFVIVRRWRWLLWPAQAHVTVLGYAPDGQTALDRFCMVQYGPVYVPEPDDCEVWV